MASVRVGRFVLDADDIKEVEMIEEAITILREEVEEENAREEMIDEIEALIDNFTDRFGSLLIEGVKVDKETGEVIPVNDIRIAKGMQVFCE